VAHTWDNQETESFGEDLTELFNLLTGYKEPQKFNHLIMAPTRLREYFMGCIRQEAVHARAGRPARIIAKVNSLIDPAIIEELYEASQAGVQTDLIVRGTCSLRPGLPGISEHIRVISIIDRYLEHARIFYFHNQGDATFLLSSADWMQRNLDRRVEIAFPVIDTQLQAKIKEFLEIQLADTGKGWWMQPDGSYSRIRDGHASYLRSQERLYDLIKSESGTTRRSAIPRIIESSRVC
jgi:polyphosphate kinase